MEFQQKAPFGAFIILFHLAGVDAQGAYNGQKAYQTGQHKMPAKINKRPILRFQECILWNIK